MAAATESIVGKRRSNTEVEKYLRKFIPKKPKPLPPLSTKKKRK
jgi:hypothetical protein